MKKLLMILLLIIVGGIKCTSIAQEVDDIDKQKIIDYINCFYTARYVLGDPIIKLEERNIIKKKGMDTVSIGYAYDYIKLDSILRKNNLGNTANNLTGKLNGRNKGLSDNNIFDFVDKALNTKDFENFKFTKENESEARKAILTWYMNKENNRIEEEHKKNESRSDNGGALLEGNKKIPNWLSLFSLCFNAFIILYVVVMAIKSQGDNETEEPYRQSSENAVPQWKRLQEENEGLKNEVKLLREEHKKKEGKVERWEEGRATKVQNEINNEERSEIKSSQKDIGETVSTATVLYYADVDVNNNQFVRTYEKCIKKSIFVIDVNKQIFTLIADEQLYEDNLSRANSSGILGACEVSGSYKKGKTVSITPGKVQQEENGKWRIINKAVIEIR